MNVLVACEESQRVCTAFRERGHNAFSCDILPCSGGHPEWHIQGNVLPYVNGDCVFSTSTHTHTQDGPWDLIIAFPPCTYMSAAGACRMYPRAGVRDEARFAQAMAAKDFFMALWNASAERIAIENPRPMKCISLPRETQHIQPYEYGEPWSKLTHLWLKGLPPLVPTEIVAEHRPWVSCGTSRNKGRADKSGFSRSGGAQIVRSKTFPGIARAMAEQWGVMY